MSTLNELSSVLTSIIYILYLWYKQVHPLVGFLVFVRLFYGRTDPADIESKATYNAPLPSLSRIFCFLFHQMIAISFLIF